jgi:hypothetical protein
VVDGNDLGPVVDAIEIGSKIWAAADERGILEAIKEFFSKPSPIIVLGSSGCGKTNFLASLAASAGLVLPVAREDRTEDVEESRVKILDRPFILADTPGQRAHKHIRIEAIREALADRPLRIINVVSYGYHEYRTPQIEDAVDPDGRPRRDFLDRHQVEELAALEEWLPIIGDRDSIQWILTVVTKADLWWEQSQGVLDYYETGPYADLIIAADPKLHHVVRPYCSVIHRFYGASKLPGTFDDSNRVELNDRMLRQLAKLASSER